MTSAASCHGPREADRCPLKDVVAAHPSPQSLEIRVHLAGQSLQPGNRLPDLLLFRGRVPSAHPVKR